MLIEKFEDIIAWQKAKKLTIIIYKEFGNCKDFGFNNQIQRASVSIINNIAEGFERKGHKEFKYFLFIAKGSYGEVRSMLHLAQELNYLKRKIQRTKQYIYRNIKAIIRFHKNPTTFNFTDFRPHKLISL